MGQNTKIDQHRSAAYRLREEIRHTEGDITQTVHTLEQRLSPSYLRRRGVRNVKRVAWQGTAKLLDLAQRGWLQASLVGASALLMLIGNRKVRGRIAGTLRVKRPAAARKPRSGTAAKAAGASALWMLLRRNRREMPAERRERKPAVSGPALAATAVKAFVSGVRGTKKTGTTRPGRKVAWRGLASAIGAALGSYWYSHKQHRA